MYHLSSNPTNLQRLVFVPHRFPKGRVGPFYQLNQHIHRCPVKDNFFFHLLHHRSPESNHNAIKTVRLVQSSSCQRVVRVYPHIMTVL